MVPRWTKQNGDSAATSAVPQPEDHFMDENKRLVRGFFHQHSCWRAMLRQPARLKASCRNGGMLPSWCFLKQCFLGGATPQLPTSSVTRDRTASSVSSSSSTQDRIASLSAATSHAECEESWQKGCCRVTGACTCAACVHDPDSVIALTCTGWLEGHVHSASHDGAEKSRTHGRMGTSLRNTRQAHSAP